MGAFGGDGTAAGIAPGHGESPAMPSDLADPLFWHGFVFGCERALPPHHCLLFAIAFTVHTCHSWAKWREGLAKNDERAWRYRKRMVMAEGCFSMANLVRWAAPGGIDALGLGGAWVTLWIVSAVVYTVAAVTWQKKKPLPLAGGADGSEAGDTLGGWSPPRVR